MVASTHFFRVCSNLFNMVPPAATQERQVTSPDELGTTLAELRTHRRKTQFEVSTALGIDRSQLAHLEGGRSGRFLAHLLNILDHLGAELLIQWPADTPSTSTDRQAGSGAPATTAAGPTPSPEPTALSTNRQAGSGAPGVRPQGLVVDPSIATELVPSAVVNSALHHESLDPSPQPAPPQPSTMPQSPSAVVGEQAEPEPAPELAPEPAPELAPAELEPSSAQLTKITNQAMNVMAASRQLTGAASRPQKATPPPE